MLISTLSVWAHDFEVNGIFYKIMTNTSVYVSYKGDNVIDFSDEYSGSINIPPTVTYNGKTYTVEGVWNNAFKYCTGVTSITIPNTVTTINQSAFSVTGITSIEIPSSVTTIGQDAFNSCESLKTAYIGGGTIQSRAFYYATKLEEVTLGNNVTEIQSVAFDDCNIKTVIIEGNANPTVNANAFERALASTGATLIVPVGRLDEFKGKTGWTDFNVVEATKTLKLNYTSVELYAGDSFTLKAILLPNNVETTNVTWSSSNETVAIVKDGVVTAHKVGTANIIVTTTDGSNLTAICKVTGEATPAERVEIKTPETTTLVVGETLQLEAIVYPETATDKTVTWVSTNENIAKIDDNGVVTAVGIGKVKIMVIDSFGHSAFIDLVVIPLLVETLELDSTSISANVGDVVTLVANIYPINATNKDLKWSVDDSNILSIESNENVATITILQEGTATITVETLDGSNLIATCVVNAVSAIDDILTDDKENAVYYTLDGTMVAKENLVPGLYIKKTSTKCTKVIIK